MEGLPEGQAGHLQGALDLTHQQDCGRLCQHQALVSFKVNYVEKDEKDLNTSMARDRKLANVIVSGENLYYK